MRHLFLPFALWDFVASYIPQSSVLAGSIYVLPYAGWFCIALIASTCIELKILIQTRHAKNASYSRF
jgi:hypothetical protein